MENAIITIGRQLGSKGREIGKKLSEKLQIDFYDKELIVEAAKESGLPEKFFENTDEKPTSSFLYSLVMSVQPGTGLYSRYNDFLNNDNIFRIQADTIRKIADEGPCIIVGRCADYILKEREDLVKIFIHASKEVRRDRIMARDSVSEKEAMNILTKADKRRGNYYNFYTNRVWGDLNNYDLSVDSGKIDTDKCVDLIAEYIKMR